MSFTLLLKLSQKVKNLNPNVNITFKRLSTIGTNITNYASLAHRNFPAKDAGSSE